MSSSRYRRLEELLTKLYSHGDCLGKGDASDEVPRVPERILKRAYKVVLEREEMTPEMLKEEAVRGLVARTATILSSPLEDAEIKEALPDEMYRSLKDDVFLFSGFKTYHQLKEAAVSLLDDGGKLKSFQRFYDDTLAVREKYNRNWLQAEYNQAVASSQMAARWHEYSQDAELYDLEYVTVGDAKVRPDHQALGGIILPMDSPFWTEAYPPNGWNCRCSVIRVPKGMKPTSNASQAMGMFEEATAGKDEIFRFNPGIKGEMFPEGHPYYGKNGYKHCLNPKLAGGKKSEECRAWMYSADLLYKHEVNEMIENENKSRPAAIRKVYKTNFREKFFGKKIYKKMKLKNGHTKRVRLQFHRQDIDHLVDDFCGGKKKPRCCGVSIDELFNIEDIVKSATQKSKGYNGSDGSPIALKKNKFQQCYYLKSNIGGIEVEIVLGEREGRSGLYVYCIQTQKKAKKMKVGL